MLLSEIIARNLVIEESQLKKDSELLKLIQLRLSELNFYTGSTDGIWGAKTVSAIASFCAVKGLNNFQTQRYGSTFAKALVDAPVSNLEKYTKGKPYLLNTYTGKHDKNGFKVFLLRLMVGGKKVDELHLISGSPAAQKKPIPTPNKDFAGSGNPLPEGIYRVGEVIRMRSPEPGVGYTKIPLFVLPDFKVNNRSELLIHLDARLPGTAGCLGTYSVADMNKIIDWVSIKDRPEVLVCDYKLGLLKSRNLTLPTTTLTTHSLRSLKSGDSPV